MEFFWNDVIVTGNDQKWYHVWRNDRMITSDHISAKNHIVGVSLRVGATIEFFEAFFRPKSCHSKSAITFFVDHLWSNGFLCLIEQARNCPFRLPYDRYRHVRLRHKLLRNRKNGKVSTHFLKKGWTLVWSE